MAPAPAGSLRAVAVLALPTAAAPAERRGEGTISLTISRTTPRTIRTLLSTLVALLLVACSTPNADGGPPPEGNPPPGTPPGLLVAAGTSYIHSFSLPDGDAWSSRLKYSAPWSTVTVDDKRRELLIASTSGAEPVVIEVFDLDTFGLKDTIEWPDSTMISTLHAIAATRDGEYLAVVMEVLSDPFLEIIERSTGRVVYTGLTTVTGAAMAWTPDDRLVVPINYRPDDDDHSLWGAIAAISLAEFEASTDGSLDGDLLTVFTRAEWDVYGPDGVAISPDGSQMVFERAGDLWVADVVPGAVAHQLTTGPSANGGARFSPDGTHLAFASGSDLGLDETYIIPNHRDAPLFIDHSQGAGNEYLLEANTMVDFMLSWLPR